MSVSLQVRGVFPQGSGTQGPATFSQVDHQILTNM